MAKQCRKCRGTGWLGSRKPVTLSQLVAGATNGRKCDACSGVGTDPNWREKRCKNCYSTIEYRIDWNKVPDLCNSCKERERAKWREKRCSGCGTSIKYHVDWTTVPDLCKGCKDKRRNQWKETRCSQCGGTVKYHADWKKVPELCKDCQERRRNQWKETLCSDCGASVKYHVEWKNIPKFCKTCQEKRRNQWKEKSCSVCGTMFRYHVDWQNVPNTCKNCKEQRRGGITWAEQQAIWRKVDQGAAISSSELRQLQMPVSDLRAGTIQSDESWLVNLQRNLERGEILRDVHHTDSILEALEVLLRAINYHRRKR